MNDTDLDQRIRDDLRRLVAEAPVPPSVDEITTPTVELQPITAPQRRRLALALASTVVALGLVAGAGALLLGGDGAGPVQTPATSPRTDPDLTVYLNPRVPEAQVAAVRATLVASPLVQDLVFIDSDEALSEFYDRLDPDPLLDGITPGSVPPSFRVVLVEHDLEAAQSLVVDLETSPGVREVVMGPGPPRLPAELIAESPIPRLVLDDPSWTASRSTRSGASVDPADVEALTVYRGESDLLPFVTVAVLRYEDDLLEGEPTEVRGRPARIGPVQGGGFTLHWQEAGGPWIGMVGIGPSLDELMALAEDLVEGDDGSFALAQPPEGMVEAFRSGELPTQVAAYEPTASFVRPNAEVTIEVVRAGAYAFWTAVTDELYGSVPVDPSMDVSTARLQYPGTEAFLVSLGRQVHHVYWREREGTVAVELTLHGPQTLLDEVLDSLREIDQATYDAIPEVPADG